MNQLDDLYQPMNSHDVNKQLIPSAPVYTMNETIVQSMILYMFV